jgi:hypothetical protein
MIIENIQYWLWTGVGLQQSMIISSHYSCMVSMIIPFFFHFSHIWLKSNEMIIENIQYWLCTEVILQQSLITSCHYSCMRQTQLQAKVLGGHPHTHNPPAFTTLHRT